MDVSISDHLVAIDSYWNMTRHENEHTSSCFR